jgi:hypothetical protein
MSWSQLLHGKIYLFETILLLRITCDLSIHQTEKNLVISSVYQLTSDIENVVPPSVISPTGSRSFLFRQIIFGEGLPDALHLKATVVPDRTTIFWFEGSRWRVGGTEKKLRHSITVLFEFCCWTISKLCSNRNIFAFEPFPSFVRIETFCFYNLLTFWTGCR